MRSFNVREHVVHTYLSRTSLRTFLLFVNNSNRFFVLDVSRQMRPSAPEAGPVESLAKKCNQGRRILLHSVV